MGVEIKGDVYEKDFILCAVVGKEASPHENSPWIGCYFPVQTIMAYWIFPEAHWVHHAPVTYISEMQFCSSLAAY